MATLTFNGVSYTVDHAVKGVNYIHGYDANSKMVVAFDNVVDFSGFTYSGAYLNPSHCLAESCNDVKYANNTLTTRDGNAIFGTYTHSAGNLTGGGENGRFKATSSGPISSIKVNGMTCSVKCGEDTEMELVAGCWYTFILDGTTVNFSSGGAGGGGLNFKVVDGTSAPASPKENTIWVNCEGMTGWHMVAEQPENMKPGEVWISTGTASQVAFNAAKKNTVMVYPISAKQMQEDGTLVDRTAKSFQNGQWVDWITYFLDGENQYEGLTGGWTGNGTIGTDGIKLDSANTASFDKYMHTANAIDFSRFNLLKIKVSRYYDYGDQVNTKWVKVTIRTAKNGGGTELAVAYIHGTGITEFNIENVNQSGYLTIQTGNTSHITVKTIMS